MPDNTPEPSEPDLPEVVAHADEGEGYPCSGYCNNNAMD